MSDVIAPETYKGVASGSDPGTVHPEGEDVMTGGQRHESPDERGGHGEFGDIDELGEAVEFGDQAAMVRPYQWTSGRTTPTLQLDLESLVSTSEKGIEKRASMTLEHHSIAVLCRHPHAVAEVAAKLSLPLGVVRVLLSDMAEQGLITIQRTVADADMAAHLVLMERVLSGLRRL